MSFCHVTGVRAACVFAIYATRTDAGGSACRRERTWLIEPLKFRPLRSSPRDASDWRDPGSCRRRDALEPGGIGGARRGRGACLRGRRVRRAGLGRSASFSPPLCAAAGGDVVHHHSRPWCAHDGPAGPPATGGGCQLCSAEIGRSHARRGATGEHARRVVSSAAAAEARLPGCALQNEFRWRQDARVHRPLLEPPAGSRLDNDVFVAAHGGDHRHLARLA